MRSLSFLLLLIINCTVFAQSKQYETLRVDQGFINHLVSSGQYAEAIYYINQIPLSEYNSQALQDSIFFLKGWAFYSLKQLDSSAYWFRRVGDPSAFYQAALFFASADYIFLKQNMKAREILNIIPVNDSLAFYARNLQYAGLSLLNHDFDAYSNYALNYSHVHYALANEELVLDDCYRAMKSHKNKSLFLAGALSAIIPGSGKIYAGKQGEGISSFLLISFLAAITAENYIKEGPGNYKTIGFGSLFTIFYLGNIYGSVASLKLAREEYYMKYENTVQLHIHIPLRTIYGR